MACTLSVCIPTWNNGHVIGETLESIVSQARDGLEIVVSDNASTDNTEEVVARFRSTYPDIRYFRWDRHVDVDENILKVVELASGDYCWLMGDDALTPGAVERIFQELQNGYDIYLCNSTWCAYDLRPISDVVWLAGERQDKVFDLAKRDELLGYLQRARSLPAIFSFLSVLMFRRHRWLSTWQRIREAYLHAPHRGYVHAYVLLGLAAEGCKMKYIADSLVLRRGENDSFCREFGLLWGKRLRLDIEVFKYFGDALFGDTEVRRALMRVISRDCHWYRIARHWYQERDRIERAELMRMLKESAVFNPMVLQVSALVGSIAPLMRLLIRMNSIRKKVIQWALRHRSSYRR